MAESVDGQCPPLQRARKGISLDTFFCITILSISSRPMRGWPRSRWVLDGSGAVFACWLDHYGCSHRQTAPWMGCRIDMFFPSSQSLYFSRLALSTCSLAVCPKPNPSLTTATENECRCRKRNIRRRFVSGRVIGSRFLTWRSQLRFDVSPCSIPYASDSIILADAEKVS